MDFAAFGLQSHRAGDHVHALGFVYLLAINPDGVLRSLGQNFHAVPLAVWVLLVFEFLDPADVTGQGMVFDEVIARKSNLTR